MSLEEGFTVRDRRIQRGETEPAAPRELRSSPQPDEPRPRPEHTKTGPPEPSDLPPEPDLATLFALLANSAMFHLGGAPETPTGATPVDLAQARFTIDLLRVLKEKTEGNRSHEENQLLEGILYDLQMRFIQAAGPR